MNPMLRPCLACLCGGLLLMAGLRPALAQPAPRLTSLAPEWIQRGTTGEVVLRGENLGGITRVIFDGDPGLAAVLVPSVPAAAPAAVTVESAGGGIRRAEPAPVRDDKRLTLRVVAAADASLAARELRVVGPGGISNPLLLNVGQWPEVAEREMHTASPTGQVVALPASISGVLSVAAQADTYRFRLAQGSELVLEVEASRRGSPLDASLAVLDAQGRELARSEDVLGLDSLLFFTAPQDGEYVAVLRDFRYQGGGNYTYRLQAGLVPHVESIFPFGGRRGQPVEVTVAGHNLEGMTRLTLQVEPEAPRGRQEIRLRAPGGLSNLVPFEVSELPELAEVEPNEDPAKAPVVTWPVVINGRVGAERDVDRFRFKADKDQRIVCEVAASRYGSRLDAHLTLTDGQGAVLARNDDAAGADARIEFDLKKGGEYVLAVRDLTGRGGDRFGYRLSVAPPAPGAGAGFTVRFAPDTVRVHRGGLARVRCEVVRTGGFAEPVRLEMEGLPSGVFAEPLLVPNGPGSGLLMVTATREAAAGTVAVRLVGTAVVNGERMVVPATPLAGDRPVRQAYLTVLEAAPFLLELATLSAAAEQGQSAVVEVVAWRSPGYAGEIKLATEGFGGGADAFGRSFTGGDGVIQAGASAAKLTLKPKMESEVGTRTVVVRGESGGVVQYARPLPVTVTQYPLILSSLLGRLNVTALPTNSTSSANEAETKIRVERRAGFAGEVELALEGLPPGIRSELPKVPAGVGEVTLRLLATEKAPPGSNSLVVTATAVFNDRTYRARSGRIALQVNAPEPVEVAVTNAPPAAVSPAGNGK
jgi:hypothetical protein